MDTMLDPNDTVTPYQLCNLCTRMVVVYTSKELWERHPEDINEGQIPDSSFEDAPWHFNSYTGPEFQGPQLDFYETPSQFLESVEHGCHICALFRRKPRDPEFSEEEEKKLELLPSICRNTQHDGCQKIQIKPKFTGSDASMVNIADPIVMHRHPLGGESIQCNVERIKTHSDSLEARYQWCSTTRSSIGFKMLSRWLQQCVEQHEFCRASLITNQTGPTRLLDLEAFPTSKDVRLVNFESLAGGAYATLSYRWGGTNPITLRRENYDQLKARIRLGDLSKTIKEAIEVCRELSMRYLWVDALCIIQDGGEDFVRELGNMGSIYAGSKFTIAAADSLDCESGVFRHRSPLYRQNCVINSGDIQWVFQSAHINCGRHDAHIQFARLSERGWVFQEEIMSPRTIHFTSEDIIWECRERLFCHNCVDDTGPQPKYHPIENILWQARENRFCGVNFVGGMIDEPSSEIPWFYGKKAIPYLLRQWTGEWRRIVFQVGWGYILDRYSAAKLTKSNDRLSALAGIAQLIQSKLRYTASYGLWLDFFLDQLHWYISIPVEEPGDTHLQLPSWSWVFTPGYFDTVKPVDQKELRTARISRHPPITGFRPLSDLYEQLPQPVSFRVYGSIRQCQAYPPLRGYNDDYEWGLAPPSEELTDFMEASIQALWDARELDITTDSTQEKKEKSNLKNDSKIRFYPDVELKSRKTLFCFLLKRMVAEGGKVSDHGLVLEQIDRTQSIYKRVGYFEEYGHGTRERTSQTLRTTEGIQEPSSLAHSTGVSCPAYGSSDVVASDQDGASLSSNGDVALHEPKTDEPKEAAIKQSSGDQGLDDTGDTDSVSSPSVTAERQDPEGTTTKTSPAEGSDQPLLPSDDLGKEEPRDTKDDLEPDPEVHWAEQIARFTFFNGSETDVEIEII